MLVGQRGTPWGEFNVIIALHDVHVKLALGGRREHTLVDFDLPWLSTSALL